MFIASVAAIGHKTTSLPQYSVRDDKHTFPIHALIVLVGRSIAAETIDNHLNNSALSFLIDDPDVVLLRVHPSQATRVMDQLTNSTGLVDRFENRAVGVLTLEQGSRWIISWARNVSPELASPPLTLDDSQLIDVARSAELLHYSERPSALLPSSEALHYEGPNGSHYQAYFRGFLSFSSRDSIDGLTFWLAPQIPEGSTILLESPSFLGVGLGIADYFRRELDCQPDAVPTIEARDFYGEHPAIIAARLQSNAQGQRPIVVLSSMISSGRTLENLERACDDAGFTDVRRITLFGATGTAGDDPLQILPMDLTRHMSETCELCLHDRTPVVPIRKSTGLVDVSALVKQVRITIREGAQAADFFGRYSPCTGAVSVCKNQHDSRRHHVIDLSLEILAATPEFQQRAAERLVVLQDKRVVILHPEHRGAEVTAEIARDNLPGSQLIPCDPSRLGQLTHEEKRLVDDADVILLVDDVAITGSRIRQYRAFLNLFHIIDDNGDPEVAIFLGVLRPSSSQRRRSIQDMADDPAHFLAVEELLLPDWRKPDCPWCRELRDIEECRAPRGSLMEARRDRLRAGGLTRELFLPFSAGVRPESPFTMFGTDETDAESAGDPPSAMQLGPRSIFGNLRDESQVFVAVASALQHMRDAEAANGNNALSEVYTSPISRVLAPEYYLPGRYYAPVILCAILRAARRFDLRATAIESELRREVGERYSDMPALRAEMLYAMARGVLPLPSEVGDQLTVQNMDTSVSHFLSSLR